MPEKRKPMPNLSTMLRSVCDPVIHLECLRCGREGALIRAEIVKRYGANITFARLRRMVSMGCDRINNADGDQCETRFLCLPPTVGSDRT